MTSFDFSDPAQRMDELERFIEYWYGPRQASYGISAAELDQDELPDPLRRLFAFAGNWPVPLAYQVAGKEDSSALLFNYRDSLYRPPLPPSSVHDGQVEFVVEDQGFYAASTSTSGVDPEVIGGDYYDPSLTDFLVRFCIRQTVLGDPDLNNPPANADELASGLGPILDACHFPDDNGPLPVYLPTPDLLLMGSAGPGDKIYWSCARRLEPGAPAHTPATLGFSFSLGANTEADGKQSQWGLKVYRDGNIRLSRYTPYGFVEVEMHDQTINFESLEHAVDNAEQSVGPADGEPKMTRFHTPNSGPNGNRLDPLLYADLLQQFIPMLLEQDEDVHWAWHENPPLISSIR